MSIRFKYYFGKIWDIYIYMHSHGMGIIMGAMKLDGQK